MLPSLGRFFLGIDLEDLHRIEDLEIESVVCRPNERKLIRESADPIECLGSLFSAKEALYKALFPCYRRYIDFTEVELSPFIDEAGFRAEMHSPAPHMHECLPFIETQRYKNLSFSCSIHQVAS